MAGRAGTTRTGAEAPGPSDVQRDLRDTREQLAATSEVLAALAVSTESADTVLDTVVRSVCRLTDSDAAFVYLTDGSHYRLARSAGISDELVEYIDRHPVASDRATMVGRIGLDRRVQQVVDVLDDPLYRRDYQRLGGFRTVVGAPLQFGETLVGVLSVWRNRVAAFDDRELELLGTFAAQAAMAIRNVNLYRALESRTAELDRKVHQLEAIGAVIDAVNSSLDLDEVLAGIVKHAVQLSDTDGGSIMEFDDETDRFQVRATYGTGTDVLDRLRRISIGLNDTFVGHAVRAGHPLQVSDLGAVDRDLHQQALFDAGWRSMLAVPLLRDDRIIGILVVRRHRTGDFSDETSEMLLAFADQSALAIVNARLYRELEVKSAELEIASRHKSEFLASMSHELRTPLNAVIGFSEVLLERMYGDLNDKQDEYLRDILSSGQHLLALLNDVLDLSKVEAGRMELELTTFGVRDAIDDSLSMVRERAAQRGIALECEVAPDVSDVRADRLRIRQVIVNLLSNAVKFTPPGGTVRVSAVAASGDVDISVVDTGPGVPMDDRERIFESFQQGGRGLSREEGTGLGLTLSRRIVHLHAGRMWLDSAVGAGSTFGFTIPGSAPPVAETHPPAPGHGHRAAPTVVVIEDDPGSRELLTVHLTAAGLVVTSAESGTEGLAMVRETLPDAVILDIRLPDLDGWDLLERLKADPATNEIPVVVASVVDERSRGIALGAARYLVKPVGRDALWAALADVGVLPDAATAGALR